MKTPFSLILLIWCSGFSYSQTTKFEKPRYLKYSTLLCPVDITKSYTKEGLIGSNTESIKLEPKILIEEANNEKNQKVKIKKTVYDTTLVKNLLIEKGYAFDVVQQIGSYSIIKFWDLKQSSASGLIKKIKVNSKDKKDLSESTFTQLNLEKDYRQITVEGLVALDESDIIDLSQSYYVAPTQIIINNSTEFENKAGLWNIGLLVLPVKIRPFATESGQFDFANGFSVGPTFAWTVHHNWRTNFTHNFLLYAGVSSYKSDESKIKEAREDYTIATFSPAVGWMWEKNNVQLSVLTGVDFPPGNLQKKWVYRNMPWFGIGVGVSLFKINSGTQTKEQKQ